MTGPVDESALLREVAADPARAYPRALALAAGGAGADAVVALRAAALAAKELGRLDEGFALLGRALAAADEYGAAQTRMTLVGLLTARGDVPAALAEADRAEGVLRGADADRLAANRACALARAGRLDEARRAAARALPRLRRGGDPATLGGLLTNLALAQAFGGALADAETTLTEAVTVAGAAGLPHQKAMAVGNLAFVVSRRGDLPRALRLFADAEPGLAGERVAQCRFDQAETLIEAGLPDEARELLTRAMADATAHGYRCDVADGLLLLAHAELADGDAQRAAGTAERARAAFARQGRTGWRLLAEHLLLRARWAAGDRSAILLHSAVATAERLDEGGWAGASAEARIIAARTALTLRRPAGHLLAPVSGTGGPASLRLAAWHATALERWGRGDRPGARAAVWAGLRVAEDHAEVFGAVDLRARAAGHGAELADLGLRLAGSARELLGVEERRRAVARRPVAVRPPRDPVRAAALAELRTLSGEHTGAAARGRAPAALSERLVRLEARIRADTRSRPAAGPAWVSQGTAGIIAALGERVLLELIRVGDELHAVTVRDGRPRRHRLGAYGAVARETGTVRFAMRRLAEREDDAQSAAGLALARERLEERLVEPLRAELGDRSRELVIAPTGALHGLPWAVLPSLAGRPFAVVPSAHAWLHAQSLARSWRVQRVDGRRAAGPSHYGGRRAVLVAGPGLKHAEREIATLRSLYPAALTLRGPQARAEAVRDALDGAAVAHLAAHGEFRDGNALFSLLRLADGPLMVHDLEEWTAAPRLVVLSACDVGRADGGDAVIGMAGALLALGAATVIASVTPVRDAATHRFMHAFHAGLAAGLGPARALASAPRSPGVTGFLCFGAG
ncbi:MULTISPECIES: CHAT domain-containing protein [Thermomonosporaceae]|uniref:CHAT domain-containing protein n=1 Tax=Thermomonosporaceae TaxID=2012 RepID=UPI00255B18C8|nr:MULTISPECIES: CHAT domain-containing protein [Thermomonosporaceae]MDL4775083.1 CHAT domain-containing protein [Actinomadura xylanilytica]